MLILLLMLILSVYILKKQGIYFRKLLDAIDLSLHTG